MPLFMVMYGADKQSESGQMPTPEQMAEFKPIHDYTETLASQGNLIWADALLPSSQGARVITDDSGTTTVQKGPFEQVVGGYAVLSAASLDQAVEIIKSGPVRKSSGCEIRQITNIDEIPMPEEAKAKGKALREKMRENAQKLGQ